MPFILVAFANAALSLHGRLADVSVSAVFVDSGAYASRSSPSLHIVGLVAVQDVARLHRSAFELHLQGAEESPSRDWCVAQCASACGAHKNGAVLSPGVSKRAMLVLNSFMQDVFERICQEGAMLCQYNKESTLGAREVQMADNLVLPGELAKHTLSEGTKAVNKYHASMK